MPDPHDPHDPHDPKALLRLSMRERLLSTPRDDLRTWSSALRRVVESCPAFGRAHTVMAFWPTLVDPECGLAMGHAASSTARGIPEPDIRPLLDRALARGVRVALPRIDWTTKTLVPARIIDPRVELTPDRYGLSVPVPGGEGGGGRGGGGCPDVPLEEIDCVLVPGVAFDLSGHRLGRGGGFYDRFLARLDRPKVAVLGVCFESQVLADIPCSPHDARVDRVLTESREIRCG